MKNIVLIFVLFFFTTLNSFSQNKQHNSVNSITFKSKEHNGIIRCATMEMDSIRRANNPEFGLFNSNTKLINQAVKKHKKKHKDDLQQKLPVLVIPVVIHVIHNGDVLGSGENILDGQAISQIQVLNEDFRRILGTPGYNTNPVGADVEIEFCLAVIDPNGNPTTGVDHVNTGVASYNTNGAVETMKGNTIWDPTQYMNMWTVRFGGGMAGTLGYAQFPSNSGLAGLAVNGGSAITDGVVSNYDAMGSANIFTVGMGGTYNPTYNLGRTMTHEVGHWLGLRHIWGDGSCGVDDFCLDTPESNASNFSCPSGHVSCGTVDMIENYMDYTDDNCMNIFTQDQKIRIRQVMLNSPRRMELPNSNKCSSPNPDDGGVSAIISPSGTVCGTTSFTPEITLTNYGSNTLTSINIEYDIDGGTTLIFAWTGSLAPSSSINITLPVLSSTAGTHIFNATVNSPNGNADADASNDASSSNFTIHLGSPIDLSITTDCWGYETFWEILDNTNTILYSGGNTGTVIPPGGGSTASSGDLNAYPDQATNTGQVCLDNGCYDFIIYDDNGDGMSGGNVCPAGVFGDYTITDPATATVLATMTAINGAFGNSETNNFCVGTSCTTDAGTMNSTLLSICGNGNQTTIHNGDNISDGDDALQFVLHDGNSGTLGTVFTTSNSPTFSFVGGMTMGTTYYISAIEGNDLGAGVVDQLDICLDVAIGTPVVWHNLPTVVANSTGTSICNGDQVTLTGTGANSYLWDNGVTDGVLVTPIITTTYVVIGTDVNNCQNTDNITITVNSVPTITNLIETCDGSNSSYIVSFDVSGGAGSYFVTGQTGAFSGFTWTSTSIAAGSPYNLTVSDANNCSTSSISGINNCLCTSNSGTMNTTLIANCNTTDPITAVHNGDETLDANDVLQYILHDGSGMILGNVLNVSNSPTFNFINMTMTAGTTYYISSVVGNNNVGNVDLSDPCLSTATGTPVVWNNLPTVIANATNTTICSGNSITLTGTGANNYSWDNGVVDGISFTPITSLTYTVIGADVYNCQNTNSITITVNPTPTFNLSQTNPTTCNGTDGNILIDNLSGNTTYLLTYTSGAINGPMSITTDAAGQYVLQNLVSGSYSNFIIDLNGCSTTNNLTLTLSDPPSVILTTNITDETCTSSNGQIELVASGGSGVFQYSINNGDTFENTNVFTDLTAGTFNILVVDNNNCQNISSITINDLSAPLISIVNIQDVSCYGVSDGQIVASVTGNGTLNYSINNGTSQNSNSFSNLEGDNYSLTITDDNNCVTTQIVTVTEPDTLITTPTFSNSSCGNNSSDNDNGSIELNISGGTTSYTVNWVHDSQLTSENISELISSNYIFTITDNNNCSLTDSVFIPEGIAIDFNIDIINESCLGEHDGSITVNEVTGGTPYYSYSWNNGSTNSLITNLPAEIYQITVTDIDGCYKRKTLAVITESDDCIDIHNAISPNNDGENDAWVITGIKGRPEAIVQIYNRWGSLIYETTNYQNDWRGTYKNKDLPSGVYYYQVIISETENYQGALTILR